MEMRLNTLQHGGSTGKKKKRTNIYISNLTNHFLILFFRNHFRINSDNSLNKIYFFLCIITRGKKFLSIIFAKKIAFKKLLSNKNRIIKICVYIPKLRMNIPRRMYNDKWKSLFVRIT